MVLHLHLKQYIYIYIYRREKEGRVSSTERQNNIRTSCEHEVCANSKLPISKMTPFQQLSKHAESQVKVLHKVLRCENLFLKL